MQGKALIAVVLKAAAAGSALLLQWLIARIYGADGSGLFAIMATTVTLIGMTAVWGQDYLALRNVAGDLAEKRFDVARGHARASIAIASTGAAAGTAATIALAFAYAGLFGRPQMQPILLAALPVCAGLAVGRVFSFTARASGNLIASQLIDGPITSAVALIAMAAIALLWSSPPPWTLGLVYGVAYLAALIYAVGLGRRAMRAWPEGRTKLPLRGLLISGVPLVFASTSPFLSDWSIIFATAFFHDAATAGQVRIVTLFLTVMFTITIAFDAVFAPSMAAAFRLGDTAKLRRLYRQYTLGSFVLNLPIVFPAALIPTLVLSLFGPEFLGAATALRIGVLIQLFTVALGPAGTVLVMGHREHLTFIVNGGALLVLIVLCLLVIPRYGVMGGVMTYAFVTLSRRATALALVLFRMRLRVF